MMESEERQKAEQELGKLSDIFPQYMAICAVDGKRLFANDTLLEFLGMTLQEFQADDFRRRTYHPDDLERVESTLAQSMSRGERWEMEARVRSKDGRYRWVLIRVRPVRDDQGKITRWYFVGADIEDRKQAQHELQQLVDAVPHFMTALSGDGRRLYVSKAGLDFFGWRPQDFFDDNVMSRAFHPEDVSGFTEKRQRGISTGAPFELEARILRKDGQYRWFLFLYNPYRNEWGQIVRWYATGTDIEDRKQADRERQQLVDTIPHQVVVFDGEGWRLYANRVVLDYLGWSLEEFLRSDAPIRAFHPDDLAGFKEAKRSFSQGLPVETEARIRRRDGQYRWFLFLYSPFRDEQGQIVRWYGTGTDIEDRKQVEEALRRSESYLEEAQQLSHTGSFAHDVAQNETVYWSAQSYRNFGFDPAHGSIPWKEARNRIHPEDRAKVDECLARAIREKTGGAVDFRVFLPGGTIKHIHSQCRAVVNATNEVVELVGTNVDVTEQYTARMGLEKALEENKRLKDELYRENLALKEEIDQSSMFEEIVGTSDALRRVLVQLAKVHKLPLTAVKRNGQ